MFQNLLNVADEFNKTNNYIFCKYQKTSDKCTVALTDQNFFKKLYN